MLLDIRWTLFYGFIYPLKCILYSAWNLAMLLLFFQISTNNMLLIQAGYPLKQYWLKSDKTEPAFNENKMCCLNQLWGHEDIIQDRVTIMHTSNMKWNIIHLWKTNKHFMVLKTCFIKSVIHKTQGGWIYG